jgi:sigma-B regulation protein RsbU (phosphoserine phosphatase)
LVIGDVTGKSVSGALVMAAARSVFRMLSEEQLTVGEIMIRANGRTKKDIKKGMFVALLYAVLHSKDRILSFCSAGQTHPMYFSSETGRANLLETKGDNFPLGILEECDYQETRIALKPCDRVIFYTDGIVEAMNEREEIFGFDRLLDVLQRAGTISAAELLREILSKVKLFAGNAPQHDDLTLIVVGVE